jgi:hypothetical protein
MCLCAIQPARESGFDRRLNQADETNTARNRHVYTYPLRAVQAMRRL